MASIASKSVGVYVVYHDPPVRECATCGATHRADGSKLLRCPCEAVAYCDKNCQQQDWNRHKQTCPLKKAKDEGRAYQANRHVVQGRHQHKRWEQCIGPFGLDAHMWHEKDGRVYGLAGVVGNPDVPDGDVAQPSWPIRKPFKKKLAKKVKEYARKQWERAVKGKAREEIEAVGAFILSRRNQCTIRVHYLMFRWPDVFNEQTLRAGSLGRRNSDGTVFWEYG